MTMDYSINLGTAGWGVWHSPDAGKSWVRHRAPFPLNSRVQALAVVPGTPGGLLAAGDTGLFGSDDGGASWARIGAPGDLPTIWSLAVDPVDPRTLFAGTRPAGLYRSRDGGRHWDRLDLGAATTCSIGTAFVTRVLVDPGDRRTVWVGVEIDGVYRSQDGGDTWARVVNGLSDLDVHDMAIAPTTPARVLASTNGEVFESSDRGETWTPIGVKAKWPLPYARGIAVKPDDPRTLFAGCGETTTGETGTVLRSSDGGRTWRSLPLPARPNATVWGLATHPADASRIVAWTLFGEVYVTEDAGESWRKITREFGEIRTAAWLPAA
jgi:photosystem II stability/assembly factor-like uncharacterized protein